MQTGDITSGIPRIESLIEIRTQTGLSLVRNSIYCQLTQKGYTCGIATRKTINLRQRLLIDRVQQIYCSYGVFINEKNLDLTVRPIAFAQVIQDSTKDSIFLQGQDYPLEILERTNWNRALRNWKKREFMREWKSKIFYKPFLCGLTKAALRNESFLSAASFQETSRILTASALYGRKDRLLGLKENLIVGAHLPIGTNARFLRSLQKKFFQ
jgi:DNA-directed RNA polymerase subunit beta'